MRCTKIRSSEGWELTVSFTYKRLPNFCYLCGKLGHLFKDCELQYEQGFSGLGDQNPYRPWLRAAPANKRTTTASNSNFCRENKGMDNDHFSMRFPRKNQATTAKKGINIFNPTPSRQDDSFFENKAGKLESDSSQKRQAHFSVQRTSSPTFSEEFPHNHIPIIRPDPTPPLNQSTDPIPLCIQDHSSTNNLSMQPMQVTSPQPPPCTSPGHPP
ncbi:hypothetical protein Salat_2687300 [Sesamum alatum]|uniref:CCHC-type domain-containing protein n=1 Tax=Sesamum alatum TaxID=300844 RepID=A0AAE1XQH9_9LAMI|nr:hypothetical protein Salat_2687300 [Sesamum alatum]